MNRPDFYVSDDYAGLTSIGVHFYYGYEEVINEGTEEEEWCFTAKFYDPGADDDVFIKIPSSKLGCKDSFDCVACLNMGIGWVFAKYRLEFRYS